MSEKTTFEEAKLCPKCGRPGEDRQTTKVGRKEVHLIYCVTELCKWFNTPWSVQVNEDGSIPQAYSGIGRKNFPKLSPESETRVNEAMEAQLRMETQPGGAEVRNPRG